MKKNYIYLIKMIVGKSNNIIKLFKNEKNCKNTHDVHIYIYIYIYCYIIFYNVHNINKIKNKKKTLKNSLCK